VLRDFMPQPLADLFPVWLVRLDHGEPLADAEPAFQWNQYRPLRYKTVCARSVLHEAGFALSCKSNVPAGTGSVTFLNGHFFPPRQAWIRPGAGSRLQADSFLADAISG
jgi:hypothetical protein